jgi:hypothetical protein
MAYQSKEWVKIDFYNVSQVGYFKYGKKDAEFCSLAQMLSELQKWVSGKTIELTGTFNDTSNPQDAPTFIADIQSALGNYLLSTWNQTPSFDGRAASIPKTATVGKAQPATSSVPAGNIPGYPTYFWFIPVLNVFATVRFEGAVLNGQQALRRYLEAFLATSTSFVAYSNDTPPKFLGYAKTAGSPPIRAKARFQTHPYVKDGAHARILAEAANIRKVMRKTELNLQTKEDKSLWQKILRRTHLSPATKAQAISIPIEYEVATHVTKAEVSEMIKDYAASQSTYEDYGFVLKGSGEQLWLSRSLAKDRISVTVTRTNEATIDAASLLAALQNQYASLISSLE